MALCCNFNMYCFFSLSVYHLQSQWEQFIFRASLFLMFYLFYFISRDIFSALLSAPTLCLNLYFPHYICSLVQCGTNCSLKEKKKLIWMMKKVSAWWYFLGVSSPLFPSTAAQCEAAAAAVADLRALVLCKAAALLVVKRQNRCYISAKPTRQEETSADWGNLCW